MRWLRSLHPSSLFSCTPGSWALATDGFAWEDPGESKGFILLLGVRWDPTANRHILSKGDWSVCRQEGHSLWMWGYGTVLGNQEWEIARF